MPNFREIVTQLDGLNGDLTIFVARDAELGPRTQVFLLDEEQDEIPNDLRYVLEVYIASDVLRVWSEWRDGRQPSVDEACEAVAYYAQQDAFQPVDDRD